MILSSSLRERFFQFISLIRLKPFDTATSEGRSSERLRRVLWTTISNAIAKGINTLTVLVTVPLTLGYLGSERYGVWMAITSITAFLSFADLGIGNGVVNIVSEATGKNDGELTKKCVSSAFFVLSQISIALIIIYSIINPYIRWNNIFNASSPLARQEISPALWIFVVCFLVNVPLSIVPRIQMGYQEGYVSSIWQAISNIIGLFGLVVAISLKAGLPWLVLILQGFSIIGNLLNGIQLMVIRRPYLFPRFKYVNLELIRRIIGIGLLFSILQISNAILYSVDYMIIINILGPEAVTLYAVPARLFTLIPSIIYMGLFPLWPAYSEAVARGDNAWVRKTLYRAVLNVFLLSLFASLLLIVFGQKILYLWVGPNVPYSLPLMIALGVWTVLTAIISAVCMFLNAINKISFQVIFSLLAASVMVVAKVMAANSFSLIGVVWAGIFGYGLFMGLPYFIYTRRQIIHFSKLLL